MTQLQLASLNSFFFFSQAFNNSFDVREVNRSFEILTERYYSTDLIRQPREREKKLFGP